MEKIVIIFTCFNRKEKTTKCIQSVKENNPVMDLNWVIVDDCSKDGTVEAVKQIEPQAHVLTGTGNLFWNGGMHMGMEYALKNFQDADYYVLINDDVEFYPGVFQKMAQKLGGKPYVLVGATQADDGALSYGGIEYEGKKSIKLRMVGPTEADVNCSTFNANCVFIPREIFQKAGSNDPHYAHSMGDFDYGFRVRHLGYDIHVYEEYVGRCNDNSIIGTWQDQKLPRMKRIKLKEGPKGLPFKDWFRYLRKNFGLDVALIRSFTPYIKIMLGK